MSKFLYQIVFFNIFVFEIKLIVLRTQSFYYQIYLKVISETAINISVWN